MRPILRESFEPALAAAQAGFESAFAELYKTYNPLLERYLGGLEVEQVAKIVGRRPGTVIVLAPTGRQRCAIAED